ncbi:MAG: PLP-dependent aminotransferase family protein [Pseudomonadota bacterium]
MTIWSPELRPEAGPRYVALADAIEHDIASGTLAEGARLPPQRDLAYRLGVTVGTVSRAYTLAAARGLVAGEVGRGTYVQAVDAAPRINPVDDGTADYIKLTVNAPPDPGGSSMLSAALAELAARPAALQHLMSYTPRHGLADHRAAAAKWVTGMGLEARADDMILTGGAHQAVFAALVSLASPGEGVLIEALTYAGICHMAERSGVTLRAVALDQEGLLPEALDAACRAAPARVLVLNPTAHNPTTATMSLARREAIVKVARAHDLTIIEDDVYGRLPEHRAAPIAALAPERTIYVTSASKSVAPGLRLGMLCCPAAYQQAILEVQHDLFLTCPPLMAEIFKLWQADGTAETLSRRQSVEAQVRQELAQEILGDRTYRAQSTSFHLWVPLPAPWRTSQFVTAARERGVAIDPGSAFAVDRDQAPHAIRISLSAATTTERLRRALEAIAGLLDEPPARRREVI